MFIVSIDKNNVKIAEKEMVTSGSVNAYECQFVFSDDWDEMTKTVTFKAGEKAISVTLDDEGKCVIPWEVLAVADVDLYVGVIGVAGAETEDPADDIVMPTIWGYMGTVRHGTTEGENTELPTPSAYERIMIEINAIKKDINDINGTFDGGEVGQVWTKTENGEEWADGGAASAPSIGDNGNWYIGETDTGVKATGTDGISPMVDITEIDNGHKVTITDKNGDQSFDVMNGIGTDGEDGFSPTIAITEIDNGYNLAITDKNGTQSVNITNGADGFSPIVDITPIEGGHKVTITDASGPHSFIVTNGTGGEGGGGVSPIVDITPIEGGHRLTITDVTGSHSADIMNGADGISPTITVAEIDGGHTVTITDKNGEQSFNVIDGKNGNDGISPTVDITTIEGGNKVTITDASGQHSADIMNGTDGISPTVSVSEIDNGHAVTITDKNGDQSFDVMNGVGADGKAATIQIGTVTEGDTPAVTNSGTATNAVFDFVLPGASGGAEYSMLKASTVSNAINEYEYSMTKSVDGGIPAATGDKITIPKSMRDICMGKLTPTHLLSGAPSAIAWDGPKSLGTISLNTDRSDAALKVAANYNPTDSFGKYFIGCDYVLPKVIDFNIAITGSDTTTDYSLKSITMTYSGTIYKYMDDVGENIYLQQFSGDTPIKMGFISAIKQSNYVSTVTLKLNGVATSVVPCYCDLSIMYPINTIPKIIIYPIGNVTISNPNGSKGAGLRLTLAM